VAVLLVEPVEAVQDEDVSVEVVVVVEAVLDFVDDDFDAAVPDVPEVPDVVAVVAVVPAAMQAPSTAVATRLAAPTATRDRAAGRRRRARFGMEVGGCSLMGPIIRMVGQDSANKL
jgi:hypothetical protein